PKALWNSFQKDSTEPLTDAKPEALCIYYAHYFAGRFKDRNGATLKANSDSQESLSKSSLERTSLETASQLVAILVEFLGDIAFEVPFYSPKLLATPPVVLEEAEKSTFTCYFAELIKDYLHGIYLNGETSDHDYAQLVGEVVRNLSTASAAKARSVVGTAIRGGSAGGLNNESIAEMAASAAGCVAKKITEFVTYRMLQKFIIDAQSDIKITLAWNGKTVGKSDLLELLEKIYMHKELKN
ncbi:hypothetical protein MUP00_12515, partial [Candidatus Bathyarchaeota archaeon]|nr:hypothetical protein [Candidatus Bathyarchaeota archaeon]